MNFEPEIKAMQKVYSALQDLDDNAKMRVINWVFDKFSLDGQTKDSKDGRAVELDTQSDEELIDIDIDQN